MYIEPLREVEPVPYFIPTPAHRVAVIQNIPAARKGYGSHEPEFRIVVAFKAAEPMALRVLVVGEHACRKNSNVALKKPELCKNSYKASPFLPMHPWKAPGGAHVPMLAVRTLLPPMAGACRQVLGKEHFSAKPEAGSIPPALLGAAATRSSGPPVVDILQCPHAICSFIVLQHLWYYHKC